MEIKQTKKQKSKVIKTLYEAGYKLYLHGEWMGPNKIIAKVY